MSDLSDDGKASKPDKDVVVADGSKFLKKKKTPDTATPALPRSSSSSMAGGANTAMVRATVGKSIDTQLGARGNLSALDKVKAFSNKYSGAIGAGSTKKTTLQPNDSESDMSLSLDEEVLADMNALRGNRANGKQLRLHLKTILSCY